MYILDFLAKGVLAKDLKRIRMMLPDRMPMVSSAYLTAQLEQRTFVSVVLQMPDSPPCPDTVHQAKRFGEGFLIVDQQMNVIEHDYISQDQNLVPPPGFVEGSAEYLL